MDRNAVLDRVFREDGQKILHAIRRAGCPTQDVEDVLHHTMILALENFDQLKNPERATAWCISIAINVAYRRLKRESKLFLVDFSQEEELISVYEEVNYNYIADDLENIDLRMDMKRILGMLSPDYATPLLMKTVYGFTYEEIANLMDIKTGTVRSRISRAKKMMERLITKERRADASYSSKEESL